MKEEIETPDSTVDEPWRVYPHWDAALETDQPEVLKKLQNTGSELERMRRSGAERDRQRAATAQAAYTHALTLYGQLVALRDQARLPVKATSASDRR
jgi:hypothetical protein